MTPAPADRLRGRIIRSIATLKRRVRDDTLDPVTAILTYHQLREIFDQLADVEEASL
ncbi:MAG: hypothetical protein JOZ41_05020 [Chloroflexi bacterium]|nr:hypothetical protein [Chloroflexota bacterium]